MRIRVLIGWIVVALIAMLPQHVSAAARPNIIIILCDDMGFSDLGCYGSEIHTPNLDSLAGGGLRFTQFYNTSRCCPSRASILTGLYPHQAGIGHMTDNEGKGLDGYVGDLNNRCVTIAQVLKPAGYSTYAVGKWHVTSHDKPESPKNNWPLQRGFDRYYGTIIGAGDFFDPGMLTRDNSPISPFADPQYHPPAGEPYYYTNAISDQTARFITEHHEQHPDQPFFFYVAYTAAHWPMQALPRDIDKYKGMYDGGYEPIRLARFQKEKDLGLIDPKWDLSPQFGEWDKVKNKAWEARCMEVYAGMIDCMDQGVGRIVESLKKTDQLDNTLILFLQDNGGNLEATGRGGHEIRDAAPSLPNLGPDFIETEGQPKRTRDGWPMLHGDGVMPGPADTYIAYGKSWANVSNTPFREYKHFVHEGGISTPLIAYWPQHISRKGELEKQPGHLIDLMATCVDLAGAKYPTQFEGNDILPMEGRSLLPAFDGKPINRVEPLYWEHEGNRAMRDGKWKLVAKYPAGKWELYDIDADRTEMHDLSTTDPDRTRAMAEKWETWAKRDDVLPWPWKPQYSIDRTLPGGHDDQANANVFELNQGDDLQDDKVPHIAHKSIAIEAKINKSAEDGVIVAQGGLNVGYSLYIKSNHVSFAIRRQKVLTIITDKDPLPAAPFLLSASLAQDGTMTLSKNGNTVATGKATGTIGRTPTDGLQVGQDLNDPVGDYEVPFKFAGEIAHVSIRLVD
jgi:arylsulfatase A-like enzyme